MDRLDLQSLLETFTDHVYFQPPTNVQMQFPCIVYKLDDMDSDFADNRPYYRMKRYMVTVIDRDPDSIIPDKVADLPLSSFLRNFVADNLHHFVILLYA